MAGKRDYLTDVKLKLIEKGYIIISKDEDYKNMTTDLVFKCNYCREEYKRTPKSALKSHCGCVQCVQKHVTGKKLHEQKIDINAFLLKYESELIDLKHEHHSYFSYKCSKCGSKIKRRAYVIEGAISHRHLCNKCAKGLPSKDKLLTTKEKNEYLKSIGSKTICIEENENKNNKQRIKFKCSCGEIFYRKWNTVRTNGFDRCNKCSNKQSYGEVIIENILNQYNIEYEREKRFEGCKNKFCFPFDFYLPTFNTLIEFDGQYHYNPIRGEEQLKKTQNNDNIKNNFCKNNNINLLRIPYWKRDNLEEIIIGNLYGNTEPS